MDFVRGGLMGVTTDRLGAPVDLATMALRPLGYNVEKPIGGSAWLADRLTSPTGSLAEVAGRTLTDMVTPDPTSLMALAGIGRRAPVNVSVAPKDYGITHRPMADSGGAARLHDLTVALPDDIYSSNALQFYGSGDPREAKILRILHNLRGKPTAEVTIYRGVPKDAGDDINVGDWVTLDESVARDYAKEGGKVISKQVKANDVTAWGDSLLEYGYYPDPAGAGAKAKTSSAKRE